MNPVVLLALAVSALGYAQTTSLDPFVGRDFQKDHLSPDESLRLTEIVGKVPKGWVLEPSPWHVWKISRNGQTRYVILLAEGEMTVPGGSSACVQLFDGFAKRINGWCFLTGYRGTPQRATLEYSGDLGTDLMVLHMTPFINGRHIVKEYFSIRNDRLELIRLEDDKGEPVRNEYIFDRRKIGFPPEATTDDQFAVILESKDKVDLLAVLTFLAGFHLGQPEHEPRVSVLIDRLCDSDNMWVRQAARLIPLRHRY